MEEKKEINVENTEDNNDKEVMTEPIIVSNPNCPPHDWIFMFKDGDGRFNYRCRNCMFGRASNEEL